MQNNEENIDKLFRNRLKSYEVGPPPDVWDKITSSLAMKRKKRRAAWLWTASAAASIALAFILGWHLSDQAFWHNTYITEINQIKTYTSKEVLVEAKNEQNIKIIIEQKNISSFNDLHKPIQRAKYKHKNQNKTISIPPTYLTSINVMVNKANINEKLILQENTIKPLSKTDYKVIASNIANTRAEYNEEETQNQWAVGIKASPEYRFDELLAGNLNYAPPLNDFSIAQNNINSNYTSNFSGGISVSFKTSKRLSFISGINYNEVTQTANNIALAFAGHNWVNNKLEAKYATNDAKHARPANTSNNAVISTNTGIANIEMPQGVQLAKAQAMYSSMATTAEEYNYEQKAGYIEVPLLMTYKIIDKKIGFHLLGGVNTNLLISNDVYLSQNDNTIASGNIEGLRDIIFSSSLGAGINYNISKQFVLSIEPQIKIQLNSLNEMPTYNIRPYTFGVYSGLQYFF